jgi:hypothetical protein
MAAALLTWAPLQALPPQDPLAQFVQGFAALAADDPRAALAAFERGLALNAANAPLSEDIRQVMQRTQALLDGTAVHQAVPPAPVEDDDDAGHVLLANYQRQFTLH